MRVTVNTMLREGLWETGSHPQGRVDSGDAHKPRPVPGQEPWPRMK